MSDAQVENVLTGCRQTLLQEKILLESLEETQYANAHNPLVESSIGQHIRHIHDLWFGLLSPLKIENGKPALIDYDLRRRGHPVEKKLGVGLAELHELLKDIDQLRQRFNSDISLSVKTEVGLDQCLCVTTESTLVRELAFVSSHATHHFALIKVIASFQGIKLDRRIGVAPATLTYERELAN